MKKIFIILMMVATTTAIGQGKEREGVNPNNNVLGALASYGSDGSNIGQSSTIINPPKNIEGSVHLFDNWRNTGVFEVNGSERKLLLKNINYNVNRDVFESQIGRDSIFTFNFDNIEVITINNREFQSFYAPSFSENKTFEVIYQNEKYALLKRYYLSVSEGSDNPMVRRPSKYEMNDEYYVKRGNSVKPIKLRKKDVLALNRKKSKFMQEFAKENDLSFKKDKDVRRILKEADNN